MRFLVSDNGIKEEKVHVTPDGESLVWNPMKKDINRCSGSIGFYVLGTLKNDVLYIIINDVKMTSEELEQTYRLHLEECQECYIESNYGPCEEHQEWGYASGCPYCAESHKQHLCDEAKLLESAVSNFTE